MKDFFGRFLRFLLSNFAVFGIGFVCMLLANTLVKSLVYESADHRMWSDLVFDLSMTLGFILPFYKIYFLGNGEYKTFYLKTTEAGVFGKELLVQHLKKFAKAEAEFLVIASGVIAVVPPSIMGKTGASFVLASASFFIDFIPNYLIQNSIVQVASALIWMLYVAALYVICLKMAHTHWEKNRCRKVNHE